jgi:hypothetical protein
MTARPDVAEVRNSSPDHSGSEVPTLPVRSITSSALVSHPMRRLRRHDPLWRVLLPSCHFRLEEQENTKLKRLIANLSMDNLVLKDIASGDF